MRSTTYILAIACLVLALFSTATLAQFAAHGAGHPLAKRQAAAGGGAGVATTYTGVQTISGYTPPASSAYGTPQVPAGTILTTISGYGNSSNTGGSSGSSTGNSSGALSLLHTPQFTIIATGMATFFCVALATALGIIF
ncbi:hypothetical protein BCV70DRAFT_44226 [Testicularia cyperi]|uniref:Uncharacterized protein n=1 Tax=Testicularia cyperi TaxID=1882483 RepID=A0A317XIF6_9BASI|nr:hypothetical protein BCV70DRAFT_44226 [Testicularia cyperi]